MAVRPREMIKLEPIRQTIKKLTYHINSDKLVIGTGDSTSNDRNLC